jgi:hypothetical protein
MRSIKTPAFARAARFIVLHSIHPQPGASGIRASRPTVRGKPSDTVQLLYLAVDTGLSFSAGSARPPFQAQLASGASKIKNPRQRLFSV